MFHSNFDYNFLMLIGMICMFFVLGVTLTDFPKIPRAWWKELKSFLSTNLTSIVGTLNTAIQSSEKGEVNGVATLGADGKICFFYSSESKHFFTPFFFLNFAIFLRSINKS